MPKPAFNPNAPHEVVKPKFDASKPFESADKNPVPEISPGAAFALGGTQGATLGFADELAGGVQAGVDKVLQQFYPEVEKKSFIEAYQENRDRHRNRAAQAEKDQPGSYLAGDLAGSVATSFSPVGALAAPVKGARFAANAGRVLGGGALAAAGGSNADLTKGPDQIGELASDMGKGALLSGALTAAGKPIGYVAGKLSPQNLARSAEERAVKAAVGQNKKVYKDLVKTGRLQSTGRDLLSSDEAGGPAVGWFSKAEDILPKVQAKKEFFGEAIGDVGKKIDAVVPEAVDGQAIATKLQGVLGDIADTPKNSGVRDALQKEIDYYAKKGPMSFSEAQKLKGSYIFKPTDSTTQTLGQDVTNKARQAVSEEMENAAAKISQNPQALPETKNKVELYDYLKNKYGSMATAAKAGEDRQLSNLSNRFVSPSDYAAGGLAGLAGVVHGGISPGTAAMGIAAAGANKLARERGSAFAARSMDKLAKIMEANPAGLNKFRGALEDAARRGPQALVVTHMLLSEDPEYRQTIEQGSAP